MARKEKEFNESFDLFIDNKKLNGFIDFFHQGHCQRDCKTCSYCDTYAKKSVRYLVPVEEHKKIMDSLKATKDMMVNGELF